MHHEQRSAQVLMVDEIGTAQEAAAVRGSAQRGVVLIGTAHGVALANLVANPDLNSLVGGTQAVMLGDDMARRAAPTFVSFALRGLRLVWAFMASWLHLKPGSQQELTAGCS